ncbi:Tetratricopeptide repeat protein, partial [human gut metagenome]
LAESLEVYKEVFSIYNENIPSDDYRMASLNNNIALLYQEMNDFPMAVQHLKKALSIIEKMKEWILKLPQLIQIWQRH